MPSFDSFIVGEDFVSEHYFTTDTTKAGESFQAEVIKLRKQWDDVAREGHESPLQRFTKARGELQISLAALAEDPNKARTVYRALRGALGFHGPSSTFKSERSGAEMLAHNVWSSPNGELLFVEAMPADALEDALSKDRGELPEKPLVDDKPINYSASKLISELYQADDKPQFIVLMAGRWLVVTEGERWAEGRYLAADALLAVERNDTKRGGELDRFLAVFGHDSLHPDANEQIWWNSVLDASVKHTVGVSKDLREGIRLSIEIIANDVLVRRTAEGLANNDIDGKDLAPQCLRFLYRILFLLYAEASPEMGIIPVGDDRYDQGYGLDRIRELVLNPLTSEKAKRGTHLYESLNRLFRLVNTGHHAPNPENALTFERLEADLFSETATKSIDDVKLSNAALQKVLEHLLLSKEARGKDRGFISYAELGVNQLGAVYEGLMSYTGFIAQEDLHEVAKDGDSSKGSWVVPVDRSGDIEDRHFVKAQDEITGEWKPVMHQKGTFVFRLAGRERQQSASYYTPEVLTKFVVSQALEELLDQGGTTTPADDIFKLTVCEPALGSGAFAIEAVRQLAAEYLKRKQGELNVKIPADEYPLELQKVKAQIALHQVHGVDLNATAVELAEVSLWLDTMVAGLQAPWFGLRLRRGNSLIGARRATYSVAQIRDKSWLTSAPYDAPLTGLAAALEHDGDDPAVVGRVHHFLLPAQGWGAASDAKEVKDLAGDAQKALATWRKSVRIKPTKQQIDRLLNLSRRVESLWKLTLRRFEIANTEARRSIEYFGKSIVTPESGADARSVTRAEIEETLNDPNGAHRRLRRVMDAWNALWFWPLTEKATKGLTPPSADQWLDALEGLLGLQGKDSKMAGQRSLGAGANWDQLNHAEHADLQLALVKDVSDLLVEQPWLAVCDDLARDQGFFHWELEFASVFAVGGFDLQVGNPPWVRPRSDEAALLAEGDPWWQLAEKPTQAQIKEKREATLDLEGMSEYFVDVAVQTPQVAEFVGDRTMYPLLEGLQPDLYRVFMERVWRSSSPSGASALLHPESHFTEKKAAALRSETYRRIRRHWQFINELSLFEIHHLVSYGVHVYGSRREAPQFKMAASLYHPDTVSRSLVHDGYGQVPGLKDDEGKWDQRPHSERIIQVDESALAVWADILDEPGTPPICARMVYPVNRASSRVLEKLSKAPRVRELGLQYSSGWHETADRKKGYFEVGSAVPESWEDVILQGPHFTVANPFAKQPNPTMKNNLDWTEIDLEALPETFIPRTSYQIAGDRPRYDANYGSWLGQEGLILQRSRYRAVWRRMAAVTGARTLHAAIVPPGTAGVDNVYQAAFVGSESSLDDLVLLVGVMSSLVADYLIKVGAASKVNFENIQNLPTLASDDYRLLIVERALRLTALTAEYGPLVESVLGATWTPEWPTRKDAARRQLLVELDALVALASGIDADELCTIYRTQFPVLVGYERSDLYDSDGRKIPGEMARQYRERGENLSTVERSWTHPQSQVEYVFEYPFASYDREEDMRKAYVHFQKLLAEKS
ncbi:DNA methyltransferase [Paenarthrobacter sp. NPDC091669]|uniref:DNA methyltransferase n=1 Tax=Paenarthrobacter sp. NPDC091669 TaxID=3364384 RepID=UPI003811CBFC